MSKSGQQLTSGDIAKILKVAPRTASKWIDAGLLPGIRLPVGKHRRVFENDLRKFMSDRNYPLELLDNYLIELESKSIKITKEEVSDNSSVEDVCN